MKKTWAQLTSHRWLLLSIAIVAAALAWLLVHRLGSLVGGLSVGEHTVEITPLGWHGIYHQTFYLPLVVIRAVVFFLFSHHGQTLTRVPNAFFGALTILTFAWIIKLWHGTRTAIMTGSLFATSAWVLHVSRLASFDVLYLWIIPTLLLIHIGLQRRNQQALVFYGSLLVWGSLLYIPGVVWLVIMNAFLQRKAIAAGWQHFSRWWQRLAYILAGLIWLPLLVLHLVRIGGLRTWLGLPAHFATVPTLAKQFVGVFVHIFIRGPEYPQLWLGRAPVLDVFVLVMSLIGIYFYARHWQASRSRLLGSFFIIGVLLVALGGPVGLSLLVPMLYITAATGIAYLLREWLQVFPLNPLARGLGIGLLSAAVALSCLYGLRAYFVAWPHNPTTRTTFRYHR